MYNAYFYAVPAQFMISLPYMYVTISIRQVQNFTFVLPVHLIFTKRHFNFSRSFKKKYK